MDRLKLEEKDDQSGPTTYVQKPLPTLPMIGEQRTLRAMHRLKLKEKRHHNIKEWQSDYNRGHRARELTPLESGDNMWVPNCDPSGTVVEEISLHSHIMETVDGSYRISTKYIHSVYVTKQ